MAQHEGKGRIMAEETIGEQVKVVTGEHPPRKDSPEYLHTRAWLMQQPGGCVVCDSPVSSTDAPVSDGMQDHHAGGIFVDGVLVAITLIGMEWSWAWTACPKKVQAYVLLLNKLWAALGQPTYDLPIVTQDDVVAFVDSKVNANVKLCAYHHIALATQDTKAKNGQQAVGIHQIPLPIWNAQILNPDDYD